MTSIDQEALRDALPLPEYARLVGVTLRRAGRVLRGTCPLCGGQSRAPFCILETSWHCHACSAGGNLVTLCQKVEGVSFRVALERLASLAGLDTSRPVDALEYQRRRDARLQREARLRRQAKRLRIEAEERAPAVWNSLARRDRAGLAYLHTRGVATVAREVRFWPHWVCVPLRQPSGVITNVVRRRTGPGEPKVAGLKHAGSRGMFGDLRKLGATKGPVVLVEGLFDWLSARVLSPERLVVGAHGAARLPDVIRAIAPHGAERGLVFVPHRDDVGQRLVRSSITIARARGVPTDRIAVFDVSPSADLNDYLLAMNG